MKNCYCTFFDIGYLDRGIVLWNSLERIGDDYELWILCMDNDVYNILHEMELQNIFLIRLKELEDYDQDLFIIKKDRSTIEYYFSCKASLALYVLCKSTQAGQVTYIDADVYFFSSSETINSLISNSSVAIALHGFSRENIRLEKFGKYNAGWLNFNNDVKGVSCLQWWRSKCIDWCYDCPEPERFADQKYLDYFSSLVDNVISVNHPGINAAPWNIAGKSVSLSDGHVTIDGEPLVFFHFHNLRIVTDNVFDLGFKAYTPTYQSEVIEFIYKPYLQDLLNTRAHLARVGEPLSRGGKHKASLKATDDMPLIRRLLKRYRVRKMINEKIRNGEFVRMESKASDNSYLEIR